MSVKQVICPASIIGRILTSVLRINLLLHMPLARIDPNSIVQSGTVIVKSVDKQSNVEVSVTGD